MATVRKRKGKKGVSYQIDYFDPTGKRVSLIGENRYLDVKQEYTTTLKELIDEYEKTFKHQPSFKSARSYFLDNFKDFWGEETIYLKSLRGRLTHTSRT